jgi:alkylation response protein AidB-like acyl-CoA dehydrogenase
MLTERQRMIRETVREFARRELAPGAAARDREARPPTDQIAAMAKLGLLGIMVPEELGGAGADATSYALAIMEIAAADGACSTIVSVHNSLACLPILKFGTPTQKDRWLRRLATGELLGAFCLTEPGAGSDAAAIKTTATRRGNRFVLNGSKQFITSGGSADLAIVFAVTDPKAGKKGLSAFVVPTDTPGYSVVRVERTMGQRGSDHCQIAFEDCAVDPDQMLGNEGDGLKIALANLEGGRIGVAAQSVGMARAAYDVALAYAKERRSFGKPIFEHQAVAFRLADKGSLDGEAVRLGDGGARVLERDAGARRLRLSRRIPGGAPLSRRARVPDLRRHVGDPAPGDRPADRRRARLSRSIMK